MNRWMIAGLLIAATMAGAAMAVETPPYKVLLHEGNFEARDYPARWSPRSPWKGTRRKSRAPGFPRARRLHLRRQQAAPGRGHDGSRYRAAIQRKKSR